MSIISTRKCIYNRLDFYSIYHSLNKLDVKYINKNFAAFFSLPISSMKNIWLIFNW